MSSKNNPDVRKASQAAVAARRMENEKDCFLCGGRIVYVKDQAMSKVYEGGKGRMKARHKDGCPPKAA
jgi:hypothetical protein